MVVCPESDFNEVSKYRGSVLSLRQIPELNSGVSCEVGSQQERDAHVCLV